MKWNDAQLKAIETRNKNILVSASAGSGKTTVLVERLIRRILDDRISLSSILAMTYTDAAASEMKKRLAKQLQERLNQATNTKEQDYIQKQLSLLPDANISTIHSFCLSIVKKFYYVTDLKQEQVGNILDTALLSIYQKEACEEILSEELNKQDPTFLTLCELFSPRAENYDALKQAIFTLSQSSESTADANTYLNLCVSYYQDVHDFSDLPEVIRDYFFDYLASQMQIYEEQTKAIANRFITSEKATEKKLKALADKQDQIKQLKQFIKQQDYSSFQQHLIYCAKIILPPNPDKANDPEYDQLRKSNQDLEDTLLKQLYPKEELFKQIHELAPFIEKLSHLTKQYQTRFMEKKKAHKGMDFHDMEAYALSILKNNPDIQTYYRNLFEEIMVDEFQDSNDVQNVLVNLIARKNNVFRVGDIKQSIYGFRHAKPSIMRSLIDQQGEYDEIIYLSNNYRSKQLLIDFNNAFYQELMNTSDFTPAFHKEDYALGGTPAQMEENEPIIFHQLMWKEFKDEIPFNMSIPALKADYIAKEIARIHKEKQYRWKDFVVLARSNSVKLEMKKAFTNYQVPFFIDAKSGFYESYSVSSILSYLRACINPYDNIAMVSALTSPLFQFTYEQLAHFKIEMRKTKERSYYAYLSKQELPSFTPFLHHHEQILHLSLKELLNELYEINQFYELHTSIQEKTNLDLLYEMACEFEKKEGYGIHGFLRYIEQVKDQESAEALPIGSEDDVVRVMSIHQSKGLQFPVVFLWSNLSFSSLEFRDFMICDNELGIGMYALDLPMRYQKTTLYRMAMEHKKNKEELEEEMRILYVATTRAQNQMHIVDAISDLHKVSQSSITSPFIYQRKGYTSWFNSASSIGHDKMLHQQVISYWQDEKDAYTCEKQATTITQRFTYAHNYQPLLYETPSQRKTNKQPKLNLQPSGMLYGTTLHNLVEKLGDLPWNQTKIKEVANEWNYTLEGNMIQTLLALSENKQFQYAKSLIHHYHEVPFAYQEQDTLIYGVMDFLGMDDQEIILIDFKSDHVEHQNDLINRYQEQMTTYLHALCHLYPNHKVHAYLYSFHFNEMVALP